MVKLRMGLLTCYDSQLLQIYFYIEEWTFKVTRKIRKKQQDFKSVHIECRMVLFTRYGRKVDLFFYIITVFMHINFSNTKQMQFQNSLFKKIILMYVEEILKPLRLVKLPFTHTLSLFGTEHILWLRDSF